MTVSLFDIEKIKQEIESEFVGMVGTIQPTLGVAYDVRTEDEGARSYFKAIEAAAYRYGVNLVDFGGMENDVYGPSTVNRYDGFIALHGKVHDSIDSDVDLDCQSAKSYGEFLMGKRQGPLTAQAVMRIIKSQFPDLTGKNCGVVGRSMRVGLPVAHMLLQENAQVTVYHSKTSMSDLWLKDIVVSACGVPNLLDSNDLFYASAIVDVGMSVVNGKFVGDVLFSDVNNEMGSGTFVTPVPSGVGPITTTLLFRQLFENAEARIG